MKTTAMVLQALASGECQSGASLARQAGLTRAAIWKHIAALRRQGLPIETRGRQGYQLPWPIELWSREALLAALPDDIQLGSLDVFWELDSTSSELQRRGPACDDLSMVLAETQTAGRGRRGRSWLSPPGLNIYLSCFKRFERGFSALSGLSLAVGVMLTRSLRPLGIEDIGLKWPNDLVCQHGKLGGILIELGGEYQGPCHAVIGIGLNLRLPEELRQQAGQAVADLAQLQPASALRRHHVAAQLMTALAQGLRQFEDQGFAAFSAEYAQCDRLYGQAINIIGPQQPFEGIGAGIDPDGALRVQTPHGIQRVDSAEVSVRHV